MEKRKIQITIETAERWYNGCDRELKELAVQTFPELEKKSLPKTWDQLKYVRGFWVNSDSIIHPVNKCITAPLSRNIFATKEQAEASVALAQLSQLREVYRNGWIPDWNDGNQFKYCIEFYEKKIKQTYVQIIQLGNIQKAHRTNSTFGFCQC